MVGTATLGMLVLGAIRNQTEKTMEKKSESRTPWLRYLEPASRFLTFLSACLESLSHGLLLGSVG